jgi:hypothetical protein
MGQQQISFNRIDATNPNRSFTQDEWDQLGNSGHAYVARERDRLANGNRGRGTGRGDGNRAARHRGGGRIVNEVLVQQQDGDTSTVTSRGGKSGNGFGIGAHSRLAAQD